MTGRIVGFFILLLMVSSCTIVKESLFLNVPKGTTADSAIADIKTYSEKYSKYDCVYLNYEYSIDNYEENAWTWKNIVQYKYIVLNADNAQLTTFGFSVASKASIKNLFFKITYPDGSSKIFGQKNLILETDSEGAKRYKFIYPAVVKGSIIEEGYELSYNIMSFTPSLEQDFLIPRSSGPIEKYSFTYAYPEDWKLQFKEYGKGSKLLYSERTDKEQHKKYLTYKTENIEPLSDEPYSPFSKEFARYVQFRIRELAVGNNSTYYANKSWSEFLKPYYGYVTDGKSIFDFNVGGMAEKLTKSAKTETDKVRAITDYVQQNIEIAKDDKDRDYGDVLKDKKGNIFRITGLVQNMLSKLKIDSEFLLVHSAQEGYFDETYYSSSQFGLPALKITAENKQILVIPYVKNLPFGYVPDVIQGQTSILVSTKYDPKLRKYKEEFWTVPVQESQKNGYEENYDLTISEEGNINVSEEKIVFGLSAGTLRTVIQNLKEEEKEKFIKNLLTYSEGDVKINSYSFDSLKSYNEPLRIKLNYTIDNLVTITPDEVLFQTGGLFSPTSLQKYKIRTSDRINPIRIYSNEFYKKTIKIFVPESWSLDNKPENFSYSNLFGSVKAEYSFNKNAVNVYQERLLIPNSQPKEKVGELIEVSGDRSKLSIPTLIFKIN